MSDFFSGIYSGVKRPDVVMNDGPLPPQTIGSGYPTGFNGIPDGQINYASTLLGDLDPYAYGEAARLSTQDAYLNIPHVCQRIVPSLDIPEAQPFRMGGSFFRLSHQVDDGDIGFVIRAMFSPYELVAEKKKFNRQVQGSTRFSPCACRGQRTCKKTSLAVCVVLRACRGRGRVKKNESDSLCCVACTGHPARH